MKRTDAGFTRLDLIFTVVALIILAGLYPHFRRASLSKPCLNNLRRVAGAFISWAADNGTTNFPMQVASSIGVTSSDLGTNEVWRQFQALAKRLGGPDPLVCPADSGRTIAPDFGSSFRNTNISYFIGVDANLSTPSAMLVGDRNIAGGILTRGNLTLLSSNNPGQWTGSLHRRYGNVGFADGSARGMNDTGLRHYFLNQGTNTIRLAIPSP